ncbi:DUF3703 domain-containing protein [Albidovulum sediminis]|uniref:DUF3703 domain-containing protein n=1 Tax=Albidovulum sediminis TaxID=3066345 RepID=A0ABT2NIY3_9RHOB|nr:DUF3703 domain-containing protein [Defluviimonas sediminis]MCT8328883.1 DUF3703 domain-containing protein [Defluviimonas sediminis]
MKPLGRGRIVLWEGASLWAFEVPRAPTARHSTQPHAHHALQFTLSAGGEFTFRIGTESASGPAVLIGPDVSHVYQAVGRNVILFVEPESRLGAALLRKLAGRRFLRSDPEPFADLAFGLTCIWADHRPDEQTLVTLGKAISDRLAETVPMASDVRVHWHMLRWGLRQRDAKEVAGQVLRIAGAATKTAVGLVPIGNTGGANVSPLKPMPVPEDLAKTLAATGQAPIRRQHAEHRPNGA